MGIVQNGWRKILISKYAKLSLSSNCLVIQQDDKTMEIPIEQMDCLIIESMQVTITTALMVTLVQHGISVITCDHKHNPMFETVPFQSTTYFPKNIEKQITWTTTQKIQVWKDVIQEKIVHGLYFREWH